MPTDDLWGELPNADPTVNPSTLLREQASLLGSKTKNVIEGQVQRINTGQTNRIGFRFQLRCTAVDNYSYEVLRLEHDLLHIYPARLTDCVQSRAWDINSEDELRARLKEIFTSDQLRKVIAALLREALAIVAD